MNCEFCGTDNKEGKTVRQRNNPVLINEQVFNETIYCCDKCYTKKKKGWGY